MSYKYLSANLLFAIIVISFHTLAQKAIDINVEASTYFGTKSVPFWLRANQWGKVPKKNNTLAAFINAKTEYDNDKRADYAWGVNIGGFAGLENKPIIQQAYIKGKWRFFEAYAGRREELLGLVDSSLSSGSYSWSGNALPMPKVQISIPEYTYFGRHGFFSFKGHFAHGWFENDRKDVKGGLLHQKSLYLRIGKPNYRLKFYTGFNHNVQWGGYSKFTDSTAKIFPGTDLGNSFSNYIAVFTGRSSIVKNSGTGLANDSLNRVGNHLGSLDMALEFNLPKVKVLAYRQSLFEDGSLFYLNNIQDGLNGISLSFQTNENQRFKFNKLVFEFLNTANQGGKWNDNNPLAPNWRGGDNYFFNGIFNHGWTYRGTSIGTPFILKYNEYPNSGINIEKDRVGVSANRIQTYFLGAHLNLYDVSMIIKGSNSKYFLKSGKYNQFSGMISANKYFENIWEGLTLTATISNDLGELFDSNFAIAFGVKKNLNSTTHKH